MTGLLFHDQSAGGLVEAVEAFEADGLDDLDPKVLVRHASQFDEAAFTGGISEVLRSHDIFV